MSFDRDWQVSVKKPAKFNSHDRGELKCFICGLEIDNLQGLGDFIFLCITNSGRDKHSVIICSGGGWGNFISLQTVEGVNTAGGTLPSVNESFAKWLGAIAQRVLIHHLWLQWSYCLNANSPFFLPLGHSFLQWPYHRGGNRKIFQGGRAKPLFLIFFRRDLSPKISW